MECIVLAGGTPEPGHPLWDHTKGRPKALLPIAGRPMIGWVLEALMASNSVDRVIVVGMEAGDWCPPGVEALPGAGDLTANLYAGIEALRQRGPALYCWSDIPLLRAEMVDAFVRDTADAEIDVNAALVSRRALQDRYPDKQDLWLRLREGHFIAADLGMFMPAAAVGIRDDLVALADRRKSALATASYVGVPVLLRYVLGRLAIGDIESLVQQRFGLRCRVRQARDPELGLDVDGAADLELCRRVLQERAGVG